jgi:hypothetical protein
MEEQTIGDEPNVVTVTVPGIRAETVVRTYTRTVLIGEDANGEYVKIPLGEPELMSEEVADEVLWCLTYDEIHPNSTLDTVHDSNCDTEKRLRWSRRV